MKDSEILNNIKKEIKSLERDLTDSAAKLGEVFYDSEQVLENSETLTALIELDKKIPEIKQRMDDLKGYNLSISESEDKIKECTAKIKELESKMSSVLEKIGVELYCFIGDKELKYEEIKVLYLSLKDGEKKSEELVSRLYKFENNDVKKGIGDLISKPFKVRKIKSEIANNNKESLKRFRDLGRIYSEIPALINEEANESVIDIVREYKEIVKSIDNQKKNITQLEKRISDNIEKIEKGSNGVRLKALYKKSEDEISAVQNSISDNLIKLGFEIAERDDVSITDEKVLSKLTLFRDIKKSIEHKKNQSVFIEKRIEHAVQIRDIEYRNKKIYADEKQLNNLKVRIEEDKAKVKNLEKEAAEQLKWLEDNKIDM